MEEWTFCKTRGNLESLCVSRLFVVGHHFPTMTHVAGGFGAFFSVQAIVPQHLRQLHVLFADFKGLFVVGFEVLNIVAGVAGHSQFAGNADHLFTDLFFVRHEFRHGLRLCGLDGKAQKKGQKIEAFSDALHRNSFSEDPASGKGGP